MFAKIKIESTLRVLTGLHIGASAGFAAIGALDNPVIRDSWSGEPMIPGSSLKGKMRTLLARSYQPEGEYILKPCKDDDMRIQRLFGTPGDGDKQSPKTARLQFSDAFLSNAETLKKIGGVTEIKSENTINRRTSIANPRSMERIVRNAEFKIVWFYTMENPGELVEDMETLASACKLLSLDYLGGSGTRGYGRVGFFDFKVSCMLGEIPCGNEELADLFKDVSDYAASDL